MTRSIDAFRSLTTAQRHVFVACFLGWTLDAFDFFLVTFVVAKIAEDFGHTIVQVAFAITITLMFRPLGALLFGICADRFGRRTPLMVNILLYSVVELLTAFSPNLTVFIVLRAIFGICMGGEWGIGAALTMESLPTRLRGVASGILQEGYAFGYLIAAVAYFLIFPHFGWRGMFVAGALPALLVLYVRSSVPESPVWLSGKASALSQRGNLWRSFLAQPLLFVYVILLMAAFNFMSHGTQDLYPTFLQKQRELGVGGTTLLAIIANVGAIIGGTVFGAMSQRIGRRRGILTACVLGAAVIPLWVFAPTTALLAVGGFSLQFFVQGAWGIVPVHLNELSPGDVRGTFPGFTYQLGNLISAGAAQIEAAFAASRFRLPNGSADYAHALAVIALIVFAAVFLLTAIGIERRGIELTAEAPD